MAYALISAVLRKLRQALSGETTVIISVKEKLEFLVSNLEEIRFYIEDADQKQVKEKKIGELVEQVKNICYDVDDMVEDITSKVVCPKKGARCCKEVLRYVCILYELISIHKVSVRVLTLDQRIQKLLNELQSYGLLKATGRRGHTFLQVGTSSCPDLNDETTVGLKEDIGKIVSLLIPETEVKVDFSDESSPSLPKENDILVSDEDGDKNTIFAIFGIVGSGKTTLAHAIFKDDQIRGYFEGFAWVTVGDTYRTESILLDILEGLIPGKRKEIKELEDLKLVQKVYKVLETKKCLVVLDDLRSIEDWENLRPAFANQPTTISRILVTTRHKKLADQINGSCSLHVMRPLSESERFNLLMKHVHRNCNPDIKEMERMGATIVQNFAGVPLAIVMLGTLLSTKPLNEWMDVCADIDKNEGSGLVSEVLSLSYNDLPHFLKPCFLYLGKFPLDYEIEAEKLYLLWMAERIVSFEEEEEEEQETVMGIGSRYLNELAARSMVQVQDDEVPTIGRYKSCRLHDVMHTLCLDMRKRDNSFEVMDLRNSNILSDQDDDISVVIPKTRSLALYLDKSEGGYDVDLKQKISQVMETANYVRSLLFLNAYHDEQYMEWPEELFNLKEFKLLRVLDFECYSFGTKKLPKGINKLLYLRYLSLRRCYLVELESYIGDLSSLETLDLRVAASCKIIIPNILWKLKRLRHLYLPFSFHPKGVEKLHFAGLEKLELLENFDTRVCDAQHLLKLDNIRILDATASGKNEEDVKAIIEHIKMNSMRQSTLRIRNFQCYTDDRRSIVTQLFSCSHIHTLHIEGHIGKLSIINSSGLTRLSLSGSELDKDSMPTLEKIPNLWTLVLRNDAYVGKVMVCAASGFPELRRLELSGLNKLQSITFQEGTMPKLTRLAIKRCMKLVDYDAGSSFPALQELKISMMPPVFEHRLGETLRNLHPSLSIKKVSL